MRIESNERIATEHEKTERMRTKAELATNILSLMPEHSRPESAHRIVDISQAVIEPSTTALEAIAGDERVESAELIRIGPDSGSR
jgi:hypothetical protein